MRSLRLILLCAILVLPPTTLALLPSEAPTDPAVVGQWSAPFDGEAAAINMVLLHTGDVLYWSGVEAGDRDNVFFTQGAEPPEYRRLDLDGGPNGEPLVVDDVSMPHGVDLFCSGQTVLPDGRVLTAGGTAWTGFLVDGTPLWGTEETLVYDPVTKAWSVSDEMAVGRWYPSIITLPDGDGLVASGIWNLVDPNTHVEIAERWHDGEWSVEFGAERLLPLYPRIHVVPGGPMKGELFYQTVGTLWGPAGEHPLEAQWGLQQAYDFEAGQWRFLAPSMGGPRQHGAVVPQLLDPDRGYAPELVTFGGSHWRAPVATPVTEVADLSVEPPANRLVDPMDNARWHLNGVLLPDGGILAVGGGLYDNVYVHGQPNVPVLEAERFDPASGTWATLDAMEVPRMYHSTALLLPDGRVLAGGHVPLPIPWKAVRDNVPDQDQVVETRMEVFSPPYLFWDDRPEITGAPAAASYGQSVAVTVDDASSIESLVLMRPGSTTHAFDADQRGILLDFSVVDGTTLTVTTPPDTTVAPPGHYMLFANKADSQDRGLIPSEAAWMQLVP